MDLLVALKIIVASQPSECGSRALSCNEIVRTSY